MCQKNFKEYSMVKRKNKQIDKPVLVLTYVV